MTPTILTLVIIGHGIWFYVGYKIGKNSKD
jgi:hypothetical protein